MRISAGSHRDADEVRKVPRPAASTGSAQVGLSQGQGPSPLCLWASPRGGGVSRSLLSGAWMAKDTFRNRADPREGGWHGARGFPKVWVWALCGCVFGKGQRKLLCSLSAPSSGAVRGGRRKCCLLLSGPGLGAAPDSDETQDTPGPVCLRRGSPDLHQTSSAAGSLHFDKRI